MMRLLLTAAAAAMLMTAAPALAAPIPEAGLTVEQIAEHIKSKGFRAEIVKQDDGKRVVKTGMEGRTVYIEPKDCNDGPKCISIQLLVGFDLKDGISYEKANDWNSSKRWAMVSLDKEMDPYLSMDVSLAPGGTYEALDDALGVWQNMLAEVKRFLGE
jgi:hypothetical protein